jgi:hypothetical protein
VEPLRQPSRLQVLPNRDAIPHLLIKKYRVAAVLDDPTSLAASGDGWAQQPGGADWR